MSKPKKILLIGPYPPPFGGVSVHLNRLLERAKESGKIIAAVYDPNKKLLFRKGLKPSGIISAIIFFLKADILHIHLSHPLKIVIGRIGFIFGKKIFYTQHNQYEYNSDATRTMMHLSDKVILVFKPDEIEKHLIKKTIIIPAYIPGINNEKLPVEIENIIGQYECRIVSVCSSKDDDSAADTYGFDLILEAVSRMQLEKKTVLILIDVNGFARSRYNERIDEIKKTAGIEILSITGSVDLTTLFNSSEIFIRATRTDGDSLSVREALQSGTAVLTSNCVVRPTGCCLFDSGDPDSLKNQLEILLKSKVRKVYPQKDFSESLLSLYDSV